MPSVVAVEQRDAREVGNQETPRGEGWPTVVD